jgi:hypothetical protein
MGSSGSRRVTERRGIDSVEDLARLREHFAKLEARGEAVPRHIAAVLAELTAMG